MEVIWGLALSSSIFVVRSVSYVKIWWEVQNVIPVIRKNVVRHKTEFRALRRATGDFSPGWHCLVCSEILSPLNPVPWLVIRPTFSLSCPLGSQERFYQMPCWHPAMLDVQKFPWSTRLANTFFLKKKERRKEKGKLNLNKGRQKWD